MLDQIPKIALQHLRHNLDRLSPRFTLNDQVRRGVL